MRQEATILCGYGKSKTMNKIFTFLLVPLRGITVQASGNVFKVRFPFAIISQPWGKLPLFITVESQVVFMISIQNVGKELFTYHLVGDGEFGFSFMHSADGQHSEVEKQSVLSTRLPNDWIGTLWSNTPACPVHPFLWILSFHWIVDSACNWCRCWIRWSGHPW